MREQAARLVEIASDAIARVGRLAQGMSVEVLQMLGLPAALDRLGADLLTGMSFSASFGAAASERLPAEIEVALFRIAQEALTNVVRHARAMRVRIAVDRTPGRLEMLVQDDGCGFDAAAAHAAAARGETLGLVGMRERVELIGGTIAVISRPGNGCSVRVRVPMSDRKESR